MTPLDHLRPVLLHYLQSPNVDLVLLGTGALLLFAECNLPGALLPGALGLTLLLSAIYGLSLHTLHPAALLLLLLAVTALGLSARYAALALLGTVGLILALATITPGVSAPVAASVGLPLGLASSLLARIACRARRNKALPSPAVAQRVD